MSDATTVSGGSAKEGRRRRLPAYLLFVALVAGALFVVSDDRAAATVDIDAPFNSLSCTTWNAVTAPAGVLTAYFELTGGGGAGGDNHGGTGGQGGRGGIVRGRVTLSSGQKIYAKVGCGGIDGSGNAAGYALGGSSGTNLAGGGGAASALCLATTAENCASGTGKIIAIAGGGGGGARASGDGACSDKNGGRGGDANAGTTSAQSSGTGRGGGRGGNGDGTPQAYGGGGGGGIGQGPGQDTGTTTPNHTGGPAGTGSGNGNGVAGTGVGTGVPAIDPGTNGRGAASVAGKDDTYSGAGGGGFTGGGSGGGGIDGNCVFGNWASAGGGGAGASWITDSTSEVSWATSGGNVACGNGETDRTTALAATAGYGGTAQVCGRPGFAKVTWRVESSAIGFLVPPPASAGNGQRFDVVVQATNSGVGVANETIRLDYSGTTSAGVALGWTNLACDTLGTSELTTASDGTARFEGSRRCYIATPGNYVVRATNTTSSVGYGPITSAITVHNNPTTDVTPPLTGTCGATVRSEAIPAGATSATITTRGGGGGGGTGGSNNGQGGAGAAGATAEVSGFAVPRTGGSLTYSSLNYFVGCGGKTGTTANGSATGGAGGAGYGTGGSGVAITSNDNRVATGGGGGGASAACLGSSGQACTSGMAVAVAAGGGGGGGSSDEGTNPTGGGNTSGVSETAVNGPTNHAGLSRGGYGGIQGRQSGGGGGGGGGTGGAAASAGTAGPGNGNVGGAGTSRGTTGAVAPGAGSGANGGAGGGHTAGAYRKSGGGGGGAGFRGGGGGGADEENSNSNAYRNSGAGGGSGSSWALTAQGGTPTLNNAGGGSGGTRGPANAVGGNGGDGSVSVTFHFRNVLGLDQPVAQSSSAGAVVATNPMTGRFHCGGFNCQLTAAGLPPGLTMNPSTGNVTGSAPGAAGVHTVSVTLRTTGTNTPFYPAQLERTVHFSWTIVPAAASRLEIDAQPPHPAGVSVDFTTNVKVTDTYGNLVTSFGGAIAVAKSVGTGHADGVLTGSTSVNAVGGVARFTDLELDVGGTGYRLTATSPGLTSAETDPFDVVVLAERSASVVLTSDAIDRPLSDDASGVKEVRYYACAQFSGPPTCSSSNGTHLGTATTAPFSLTWTPGTGPAALAAGPYRVTSVLVDNVSNTLDPTVSTPVLVYTRLTSIDYLVVGGGGAGGPFTGGGGGAGGMLTANAAGISTDTYNVTVGAGGIGREGTGGCCVDSGNSGAPSSIAGLVSAAGGGGGGSNSQAGRAGGSGGGGGHGVAGGAGTSGQGFGGGQGSGASWQPSAGAGGGGGKAAVGNPGDPVTKRAGAGGAGASSSITGSPVIYAAGGGGGCYDGGADAAPTLSTADMALRCGGAGGSGIGGNGGYGGRGGAHNPPSGLPPTAGAPSTGSGGGGQRNNDGAPGGPGGSGIVVIRYAASTPLAAGGDSVRCGDGFCVHIFTTPGTATFRRF